MNTEALWPKIQKWFSAPIVWILAAGLSIRLYSAIMRTIINPDGAQYIYQASALFNQNWSSLLDCKLTYLSPLPFFIAAGYAVCRDWIIASHMVNVLFGWSALLPLYFILRRFFDRHVCNLTILIFALMPVLVDGSANVIRGPIFWFCLCLGMLFFVRQWDEDAQTRRFRYDLLASSLFFLLATWSRIEGIVFLAVPLIYLLFTRTDRKAQRCLLFLIPMGLLIMAALGITLASGANINAALRFGQVLTEGTQFVSNIHALESWIKGLQSSQNNLNTLFLERSREALILIPIVVIFQNILEGVFYPFALILFVGLFGLRQPYQKNSRLAFFLWQTTAGLLVLYIHMLQTWIISYRFLAVMIFPGCVLMANGVQRIIRYLAARRRWDLKKAIACVTAALVLLGLPKSLKPEERDKLVYRQAAQMVTQTNIPDPSWRMAGFPSRAIEWITLYAHRNISRIPCALGLDSTLSSEYLQFVAKLDAAGIRYILYEERFWPHHILDLPSLSYGNEFRLLGRWKHPDSKTFFLLERIKS